ncbi:hypothetical protein AC244_27485 [Ensifer adhaerens]|uniref:3-hydroxyacyl-CoA dehydrogenase n=1 Tax=Ensifer adhaerens TaxID=106592 RepID=A0A0L8BI41_ENSAD|nr:3-hydroxyacyl-CoA dehydrogenase NAD-binding domain-containing protein [Ensifer adhaerens]KOF14381.1 hypothetical protein AC244_27485 [Ensifer adhaerens]
MSGTATSTGEPAVLSHWSGDILIVSINNPPVNVASLAVRRGLLDALISANGASGVILTGNGRSFMAGADIKEFSGPILPPTMPDVIAAIETLPIPVVAVIDGIALGAGLELALGCDAIVASSNARLGLPEISLGIIPGAGGTQRLPRRIGIAESIRMICGAEIVQAQKAASLGLIDRVVTNFSPITVAIEHLHSLGGRKRPSLQLAMPEESADAAEKAEAVLRKRGQLRPNVEIALGLIKRSEGVLLADERREFERLRLTEEAAALRHIFFAERKAVQQPADGEAARDFKEVGIIGGGTMGQGIARAFLNAGYLVTLIERDPDLLRMAMSKMFDAIEARLERGRISKDEARKQRSLLTGGSINDISRCDLVVEAIFEDADAKKRLFAEMSVHLRPYTMVATNTSYLDINQLGKELSWADRLVGLHFFSPADVMKLVEVIETDKSAAWAVASAFKLSGGLGKKPVLAKVGEGFIANRIYSAYRGQAELLVLEGASPAAVDSAVREFGFPMGPFEVSDMSGLDIAWAMRRRRAETRNPHERYVAIPDRLCEAGRLGIKTKQGWYDYRDDGKQESAEADQIIRRERAAADIVATSYSTAQIQCALLAAILNEAACVLEDGVAAGAGDIDVVLVNGYGFPRWLGGPIHWAGTQALRDILNAQEELSKRMGPAHRQGDVERMIAAVRSS